MEKTARKRLMLVLRIVVCVGALWLVLSQVTVRDYVTVRMDGQDTRCELLSPPAEHDGQVHVRLPGGSVTHVPRDSIVRRDPNDPDSPEKIEYGLITAWRTSDKPVFLLCFLFFAPVPLIQSLRFKVVLAAQEIHITYWESVKLSVAGNFLNFLAILGSTGGDVFKAIFIGMHAPDRKTEAYTTVLLDRIIGLLGLVLLVGLVVTARMVLAGDAAAGELVVKVAIILGVVGLGVILFMSKRTRSIFAPVKRRIPERWLEHVHRADKTTQRLLRHRVLLSFSLVLTIAIHGLAVTSVVMAARALRMEWNAAAIGDYYVYIPTGSVVAAVPISFQGAGTMEAVYFLFLKKHGSYAQLLCLALALRLIHLIVALPGVLVMLTGAYRPKPPAGERASTDPDDAMQCTQPMTPFTSSTPS